MQYKHHCKVHSLWERFREDMKAIVWKGKNNLIIT